MPVILISEDERMKWTHAGTDAGFIYRRITKQAQREIQAKYTVKGVTDNDMVSEEVIAYCIYDWFGFQNAKGEAVAYKKDLLKVVPEAMKTEFIYQIYSLEPVAEIPN